LATFLSWTNLFVSKNHSPQAGEGASPVASRILAIVLSL